MVSTLERRKTETPTGQVLRLPCKFIQCNATIAPESIDPIAKELVTTGRNVLPVMVEIIKTDKYAAVFNQHILLAAKQAGLDFVYCIVVDRAMTAQLKIEAGKTIEIDLNLATEAELTAAFTNIKTNIAELNKIEPQTIAKAIVNYRSSNRIKDLNFLTKLKCGIGKAKLPLLTDRLQF
jgi:DNA uptake protein ComE-like DNA-binding protein